VEEQEIAASQRNQLTSNRAREGKPMCFRILLLTVIVLVLARDREGKEIDHEHEHEHDYEVK
jgi:hypothetical protein